MTTNRLNPPKGISIRVAVVLAGLMFGVAISAPTWANVCVYRPPKVRQLHGKILDPSNEPIPEVIVTVMKGEKILKTIITSDDGAFDFGRLPDGKYEIDAAAGGFVHARYAIFLGHQAAHWERFIQIKLAVGIDQCDGTIGVVEKSAITH